MQNPIVTFETTRGTIKAELYPEIAPNTVNNFISLIQKGFYDGTIFHRVIPGFMIQGGDPEGTGMGGPGYGIKGEFAMNGFKNDLKHTTGVLSMARASARTAQAASSSSWSMTPPISTASMPHSARSPRASMSHRPSFPPRRDWSDRPREDQVMTKVTVETFGVDYDEPVTGPERG